MSDTLIPALKPQQDLCGLYDSLELGTPLKERIHSAIDAMSSQADRVKFFGTYKPLSRALRELLHELEQMETAQEGPPAALAETKTAQQLFGQYDSLELDTSLKERLRRAISVRVPQLARGKFFGIYVRLSAAMRELLHELEQQEQLTHIPLTGSAGNRTYASDEAHTS